MSHKLNVAQNKTQGLKNHCQSNVLPSCKCDRLWTTFFLGRWHTWCVTEIVNTIRHNWKIKIGKISNMIFGSKMGAKLRGGGLHILNWGQDRVNILWVRIRSDYWRTRYARSVPPLQCNPQWSNRQPLALSRLNFMCNQYVHWDPLD